METIRDFTNTNENNVATVEVIGFGGPYFSTFRERNFESTKTFAAGHANMRRPLELLIKRFGVNDHSLVPMLLFDKEQTALGLGLG